MFGLAELSTSGSRKQTIMVSSLKLARVYLYCQTTLPSPPKSTRSLPHAIKPQHTPPPTLPLLARPPPPMYGKQLPISLLPPTKVSAIVFLPHLAVQQEPISPQPTSRIYSATSAETWPSTVRVSTPTEPHQVNTAPSPPVTPLSNSRGS